MSAFIEKCLKKGKWDGIGAGKDISVKITSPDFGCSSIAAKNYSADISDGTITAWSTVFEPEKRKAIYYFRGDYTKPFVIEF